MPKKKKNKKKNKYSSDSLTILGSIFLLAGGGILIYVVGVLIHFGISFALFKFDANSCNKGEESKCDKLLNYDMSYDILYNNAESVTNPYFKKIYDEYQTNEEKASECLLELIGGQDLSEDCIK
ncbi:hypothetical protein [Prochlorococcus marinus]|uniref:hypothetical protein n=1 Tax=Prochlorococcus marinus TaxID=1219 RepID=UPI001ADAB89E|nr:hypothetical protein [Prochlorococcus marinus]MBO8216458.1 hypothetical protein [Prochlorococcus marinus XMU1405]MBW3039662.1 hypothetical protein [Prochlorococcus marinus str. MU1405]MBW3047119.1 hypothetical protein [Prochlorococcus marinus str. MU1406]